MSLETYICHSVTGYRELRKHSKRGFAWIRGHQKMPLYPVLRKFFVCLFHLFCFDLFKRRHYLMILVKSNKIFVFAIIVRI